MREKRWSGRFIIVWDDNAWEFFRCCRCGRLLKDRASRQRGLGRECQAHAAVDLVWSVKRQERKRMREDLAYKRLQALLRGEDAA